MITPIELLKNLMLIKQQVFLLIVFSWVVIPALVEYGYYVESEINNIRIKINYPIISKEDFEKSIR